MLDHAGARYKVGDGYDMFSLFIAPALQSVTKEGDDIVVMTLKMRPASLRTTLSIQSMSVGRLVMPKQSERPDLCPPA